jgi:hypothetical protein
MKPYTEYQFLIFSQIFYLLLSEVEERVGDLKLEYDLSYPVLVETLKDYLGSDYNDPEYSEYDCMATYLKENINTIAEQL